MEDMICVCELADRSSPRGITQSCEDPEPYFEDLMRVYARAYAGLEQYAYEDPEELRAYLAWLKYHGQGKIIIVRADGRIIGFAAVECRRHFARKGTVGEIHEIVVDPRYQQHGIGRQLFAQACRMLEQKGCDKLKLLVGATNERARGFYTRQGFRETGRLGKWIRMERVAPRSVPRPQLAAASGATARGGAYPGSVRVAR